MENNIVPEASKYTACSLKVSGTVSLKEATSLMEVLVRKKISCY